MQKICANCAAGFEVMPSDEALLSKLSPIIGGRTYPLPLPSLCSDCRMQRRLMFRNQQTLYRRACDRSGASIISIYSSDKDQVVYSPVEWWSDAWDAVTYGREIDWSQPFFSQFKALMREVPHIGVLVSNVDNSDFTNQSYNTRNCYLSSAIKDCEDVFYSQNSNKINDCTDVSYCFNSELLYECTDTHDSYACTASYHCINCSDSSFLFDCIGCRNCFGCVGLRQQQYHFFSVRCEPEEYARNVAAYALHTHDGMLRAHGDFRQFLQRTDHARTFMVQCENVTGNNIKTSSNCRECYDCLDLEDCAYSTWIFESKDAMDCYGMGASELVYNCVGVEEVKSVACSFGTTSSNECYYTDLCFNCSSCFGCVGLRRKKYCIFNKEYTQAAYEELVPRLIEAMKAEGSWGEFFPPYVSAFAYNESKANEVYPLTKEQAVAKGYLWKDDIDEVPKVEKIIPGDRLPSNIDDIPDDLLQWAVSCEVTQRPFRITKSELAYYRKLRLPVPHLHPDVRLKNRMRLRNV